jgi:hypothetical protein
MVLCFGVREGSNPRKNWRYRFDYYFYLLTKGAATNSIPTQVVAGIPVESEISPLKNNNINFLRNLTFCQY